LVTSKAGCVTTLSGFRRRPVPAHFFTERVLPETAARLAFIQARGVSTMELADDAFESRRRASSAL
jgi:hypothetical protein